MSDPVVYSNALAEAAEHIAAVDAGMAEIIATIGPCSLEPAWHRSPYESLVRAVAHQQLQGKAAEAILGRFLAMFPAPFPSPAEVLAVDDDRLRATGFSRSKIAAIRDIAGNALSGVIPDRAQAQAMTDVALIERLISIRGVGQWTVEMLLIFTLGRLDVFPADDFGVRNGMRAAYHLETMPSKREAMAMGERWRPFRSVASWYLWRVAATARRPLRPTAQP